MKQRYTSALLGSLVLSACGARVARPTAPVAIERIAEAGTPLTPPVVRALAQRVMPVCEAGELQSVAVLAAGVSAHAAIARNEGSGLLAYVTSGNELRVQPLDGDGHPHGDPTVIANGRAPAVIAYRNGYVLAYATTDADGHVRVREFDVAGAPRADAPDAQGPAGAEDVLAVADDHVLVAAVSHDAAAIAWRMLGTERSGTFRAPAGGAFALGSPPQIVAHGDTWDVYALAHAADAAPGDESVLLHYASTGRDAAPQLVARDLVSPSAYATEAGTLLGWRARVASRDVAMRTWWLPSRGEPTMPPTTVSTFRGAFDARVGFAQVAPHTVGAFTLSTLADDAGGTLNVSLLTDTGEYIGRQPLLVSALTRNARVVSAARDGTVWFAIESRGDDGQPALGTVTVTCHADRAAERLNVPPPGVVQRLGALDSPANSLANEVPAAQRCHNGAPVFFATHASPDPNDALAASSAAAVALGADTVVFVVTREAGDAPPTMRVGRVDARAGVSAPRVAATLVGPILASGSVAGLAYALAATIAPAHDRAILVAVDRTGRARPPVALPFTSVSSAAFVPGGNTVFVVGTTAHEGTSLFAVTLANGRATVGAPVAHLAPGDRVLDAQRTGATTTVLLARPDALGDDVARMLATVTLDARRTPASIDPFADPLAYGRGEASLIVRGDRVQLVTTEREYVRAGALQASQVRELRSVYAVQPGGGRTLGRAAPLANGRRWMALSSGDAPADTHASAMTLVALESDGTVHAQTRDFPSDPGAVTGPVAMAADGERATLVYARTAENGAASWMVSQTTCGNEGGR